MALVFAGILQTEKAQAQTGVYEVLNARTVADFAKPDSRFADAKRIQAKRTGGSIDEIDKRRIKIAIVDTGIWAENVPYFNQRWVAGMDFTAKPYNRPKRTFKRPDTMGKHGSCVASIAGYGTNQIQLIDVMVAKTQEGGGKFDPDQFVAGVKWAIGEGAKIINCSKQVNWQDPKVQSLVRDNPKVVFVSTAGNNNAALPSDYRTKAGGSFSEDNNILVGGCGNEGEKIPERGFGAVVDIAAPSVEVPCLAPHAVRRKYYEFLLKRWEQSSRTDRLARKPLEPDRDDLTTDDGVSFACPMVANTLAKMWLLNPDLSPKQLISRLVTSAEKKPQLRGANRANGMMNPHKAYVLALNPAATKR
jgi:hypothetical protein